MGIRYVIYRISYVLKIYTGLIKKKFPVNFQNRNFIPLSSWRKNTPLFFFETKEELKKSPKIPYLEIKSLKEKAENIKNGNIRFFSSVNFQLRMNNNWIINPDTGYKYNANLHWSKISDYSKETGDIKYVWEKARFSFLYDLIRYDLYSGEDQSEFVFSEIEDFIDKNPINKGPNYKCSQEISIRILNWTFALNFYKNSVKLNDALFNKIINHIYRQLHHVYRNINFSRISVRNNHAITETMMLYLSGYFFPFIPETKKWSLKGKKWFEQEIAYQIYEDGSYLQFSHNYHRVVVQLLTWAIAISEINNEKLSEIVYNRAKKTLEFLFNHQEKNTGRLPNYGMNDGALFFPLNDNDYRDYRPQLQALANVLGFELYADRFEDSWWYLKDNRLQTADSDPKMEFENKINIQHTILNYPEGGFYGIRENDSFTAVRCGTYKNRPAQADALHLDIWYKNENIFFDPGTYKYNTDEKYLNFYFGTTGHNTVTIGDHSQMFKGGRFIWYFWTEAFDQRIYETKSTYEFEGKIKAFHQLEKNIFHRRKVIKYKKVSKWKIIDEIIGYKGALPIVQHWNINPKNHSAGSETGALLIKAYDKEGNILKKEYQSGWYSETYGIKKEFNQLIFKTNDVYIETDIEIQ